jgi:2-polyprenyl-3-methyl-5-hydroxy-6-metoxy-1,4-benzoquinol methylase
MKWKYWLERPPARLDLRSDIFFENTRFEKHDNVLEVGVGMAQTTYKLATRIASVTAIDISEELIRYLSERKRVPNIDFVCADACDPKTAQAFAESFDKAISGDTLEHVESPQRFFLTVATALKPGGAFLLTFPNERSPSHGITRFQSRSELVKVVGDGGFSKVDVYCVELRKHAALLEAVFGGSLIRFVRIFRREPQEKPQVFHECWTFHARNKLERISVLINAYWGFLHGLMCLSRPLYRRVPAGEEVLDKQLLIIAVK